MANHGDGVSKLYVQHLHAVEAGGNHVAQHDCRGQVNIVRQKRQVGIRLVYVEIFPENAILEVGELPAMRLPGNKEAQRIVLGSYLRGGVTPILF